MSWLTKQSLRNRIVTFILVGLVVVASVLATLHLKEELIPDIELPMVMVITPHTGASSEKVMNDVTIPVEDAISGIDGLKNTRSSASQNYSFVLAEFEFGTDMDEVEKTIKKNLGNESPSLLASSQFMRLSPAMMPLVILDITAKDGESKDAMELKSIANDIIEPQLESIGGVSQVEVLGGGSEEPVLVNLDVEKINAYHIPMYAVIGALSAKEYSSLDEVKATPVGGTTLGEVATVTWPVLPQTSISRTNGMPSVSIMVFKDSEANTVSLANEVMDKVEEMNLSSLGVQTFTILDQASFIERSISGLTRDAIIGMVLAILIILLFLWSGRASLVTAISIPLSILIAFLVMYACGITINILTLSALAIAIGRVVDDSIVVLENTYRHLQQGEGFKQAAFNGAREVATPIASATIATVIIFVPVIFVGGIVGEIFRPFALTLTFALLASLIVALMVVPPLSGFISTAKVRFEGETSWYHRAYGKVLGWSLGHRAIVLIIAVALFAGSFALIPLIGTTFIPTTAEKMLEVRVEMPRGTDLGTTINKAKQVEDYVKQLDYRVYETSATAAGQGGSPFSAIMGSAGSNVASMYISLSSDADVEMEAQKLRDACQDIAGDATITVSSAQSMEASMTGGVQLIVTGNNSDDVNQVAVPLEDYLKGMSEVTNVKSDMSATIPMMDISLNPDLSPGERMLLAQQWHVMGLGTTATYATWEGKTYEVFVSGIASDINVAEAKQLWIVTSTEPLAIAQLDDPNITTAIQKVEAPETVRHYDGKSSVMISATITAEDVGAVNEKIQEYINTISLPAGTQVKPGGVAEQMDKIFHDMGIAILIAIGLAYVVVMLSLRSWLSALIIMFSLPLASIGALLGLFITGRPLGASALMGVLMLVGIVLTNAIVLLAFVDDLRKEGYSADEALKRGGLVRLRPILMTALTTMIALVPLALGMTEGGLMAAELATVVIGGLLTSTLLTLMVIPVLYSLTERIRHHPQHTRETE